MHLLYRRSQEDPQPQPLDSAVIPASRPSLLDADLLDQRAFVRRCQSSHLVAHWARIHLIEEGSQNMAGRGVVEVAMHA